MMILQQPSPRPFLQQLKKWRKLTPEKETEISEIHKNMSNFFHQNGLVKGPKIQNKGGKFKVENVLKGSLDLIPSPSPSVKIQIMGGKIYLRCEGKTLLGIINKFLNADSLLTSPSNILPYSIK